MAIRTCTASWCINRKVDGGLELPLKDGQYWLGHASLKDDAGRYGPLFPKADATAEMEAAERAVLGKAG